MQIGFIGIGRMGSGMAANLLAAGHTIAVYNRTPAKAEPLLRKGAHLAKSPAEAARGDIIITMLADDRALAPFQQGFERPPHPARFARGQKNS